VDESDDRCSANGSYAPPDDTTDDLTIVARVLAGDINAYRTIVERYQRRVFRLGLRFHRVAEDIQDYVQEVFLKAYVQLSQFGRRGRFYSWLMRIAYNHGLDRVGKRSVEVIPEEYDPPDPGPGTEELALRSMAREELRAAVAGLPAPVGTCVDLFFFFELTYDEVSNITGIPVNTVKSHVFRAKQRLRKRLAGSPAEAYHDL